jgi:hypothetical protein
MSSHQKIETPQALYLTLAPKLEGEDDVLFL